MAPGVTGADISLVTRIEPFDYVRMGEREWGVNLYWRAPLGEVRMPYFFMDELGALKMFEQTCMRTRVELS